MRSLLFTKKPVSAAVLIWAVGILTFPFLLTACGGKKDDGIEAVFVADFGSSNYAGDNDSYTDGFLSPNNSTITVGVKSVQLIKSDETSPSYTIFDTNSDTQPLVMDLTTVAQSADRNSTFPSGCPCDYSQVQAELTYFEIQIPVDNVALNRLFRFYTLNLSNPGLGGQVKAGDVLISNVTDPPQFSWVDTSDGSLTGTRPAVPLQVPASRFPDHVYSSTVIINLPKFLNIPNDPKGTFTVKLTVHAGGMFFYDDTDVNQRFDFSTDGQLNGRDPNSHYYPVYPNIDAAASS
jgi:hypothetical protein